VPHPWKCPNGHENVSEVPDSVSRGPRKRFVLDCPVPGCTARGWIFVGSEPAPLPTPTAPRRHK
jgi:hypothetical protein